MDIAGIQLRRLTFPGPAGGFQAAGQTASLIRELGDNYAAYHEFLARQMLELGGRPDPLDYDNFEDYAAACARLDEILSAEALIRRCRAFRQLGERLADPADGTPFVDAEHLLVSAEKGRATMRAPEGYSSPRGWAPPGPPGEVPPYAT
jgi:hypothetical protein